MNILTFDIEEWSLEKDYFMADKSNYAKFDYLLDHILEQLNERDITATFFCLGKIARDFPHVIKKIASENHEIGSHSHSHRWVNKMTEKEFRIDTKEAIDAIEQVSGKKVRSFRAPAFSIGESNKWAIEVLAEAGIENDSSIFPGVRDFGGFPTFKEQSPCIIEYNGIHITEFPIPLYQLPIIGKSIAYSGGGYFRMLPQSMVSTQMKKHSYNMCYFHIEDLIAEKTPFMTRQEFENYFKENGSLLRRVSRYFKSNIGRRNCLKKLDDILTKFPFTSIDNIDLKNLPIIQV